MFNKRPNGASSSSDASADARSSKRSDRCCMAAGRRVLAVELVLYFTFVMQPVILLFKGADANCRECYCSNSANMEYGSSEPVS